MGDNTKVRHPDAASRKALMFTSSAVRLDMSSEPWERVVPLVEVRGGVRV